MYLMALNVEAAKYFVHRLTIPHAVISITDPCNKEPAIFSLTDFTRHILYPKFYDINDNPRTLACLSEKYSKGLFTKDIATDIVNFVRYVSDKVELIVCHCDSGVSRSAAVVGAISVALNGNTSIFFETERYTPNMFVYDILLDKFME